MVLMYENRAFCELEPHTWQDMVRDMLMETMAAQGINLRTQSEITQLERWVKAE